MNGNSKPSCCIWTAYRCKRFPLRLEDSTAARRVCPQAVLIMLLALGLRKRAHPWVRANKHTRTCLHIHICIPARILHSHVVSDTSLNSSQSSSSLSSSCEIQSSHELTLTVCYSTHKPLSHSPFLSFFFLSAALPFFSSFCDLRPRSDLSLIRALALLTDVCSLGPLSKLLPSSI